MLVLTVNEPSPTLIGAPFNDVNTFSLQLKVPVTILGQFSNVVKLLVLFIILLQVPLRIHGNDEHGLKSRSHIAPP